jgi:hypothetical protein
MKSELLILKLYFFLCGVLLVVLGVTQFINCFPLFVFKAYSVIMTILGGVFIYLALK